MKQGYRVSKEKNVSKPAKCLYSVFKNAGPFQPIVWLAVILLFAGLTIALGRVCCSIIRLIDSTGNKDLDEESVVNECRKRWGWEGIEEERGYSTVTVMRLDHESLSRFMPEVVAYRATVLNPDVLFGSGPLTITATCLVKEKRIVFLQRHEDVERTLGRIDVKNMDVGGIVQVAEAASKLLGLEIQGGAPSARNPWVVTSKDGRYPQLITDEDRDEANWTVIVSRPGEGWVFEGTLVSPDDFICFRYRITVDDDGNVRIIRGKEVFLWGIMV